MLKMRFSDDQGDSRSDEFSLTLIPDTRQRIEFRSLGAFAAPTYLQALRRWRCEVHRVRRG